MGIIKLFPRSIRMAIFYAKSKKIVALYADNNNVALTEIINLEKKIIGGTSIFKGSNRQDEAIAIGMKDMAKIFIEVNSPDNALRYLESIEKDYEKMISEQKENESLFEGYAFVLFYFGKAYAQKGMIDNCNIWFDKLNIVLNSKMSESPSNSRLCDIYRYMNKRLFNVYLRFAEDYPEKAQEVYCSCLQLLKKFEERDPGNEQLNELIQYFQ